jgi:DNA-binding HxlR family transcriptional regulator
MHELTEPSQGCITAALHILGDKWSGLIIRELITAGPRRFSELEQTLVGISPRTLSQRLDMLAACGILTKATTGTSSRVVYSLTPKGEDLTPILRAMIAWGDKYPPVKS